MDGTQVCRAAESRQGCPGFLASIPEALVSIGPAYGNGGTMAHSPGQGVVFAPGTDVVIKYDASAGAANPITFSYLLIGYWTDK